MDLSNIQPIFRRYENELQAEKDLARLSLAGGKTINVITIYPKGSFIYVWFMYDRTKIGYKKPEQEVADKPVKKVNKKKTRKKAIIKKGN